MRIASRNEMLCPDNDPEYTFSRCDTSAEDVENETNAVENWKLKIPRLFPDRHGEIHRARANSSRDPFTARFKCRRWFESSDK